MQKEIITQTIAIQLELAPYQNGRPSLTLADLRRYGPNQQANLFDHLNNFRVKLVSYRNERGVAPNLKTQAALVLHQENIGDPTQLIVDTVDPASCEAYGEHLFENGATEIWMGTAHDNDMTDIHGTKDAETPLIKGIKNIDDLKQIINLLWGKVELSQISPQLLIANIDKSGKQKLEKVFNFMPNYYIDKLAKRLAMAIQEFSPTQWNNLTHTEQLKYLAQYRSPASESIGQILSGKSTWEELNKNLKRIHQPSINPEDHPLHKMFRQDKNEWQIADIMSTTTSIILEIPRAQFTHREGNGNSTVRIEFTYEDGQPLVICKPEDYIYLPYILNSANFFKTFEEKCLPRLGKSSYYQLEIMLDTKHTHVAFGTDSITGEIEKRIDTKTKFPLHFHFQNSSLRLNKLNLDLPMYTPGSLT